MEILIAIVIILALVYFSLVYWPVTLGIVFLCLVIYVAGKLRAAELARIEEEQQQRKSDKAKRDYQRRQELEQQQQELERISTHKNQQKQYHTLLIGLASRSFTLFEAMPKHLMSTEELLDQAEADFEEGAFAPFWDSVEHAAMQLGHFDESVRTITTNATQHTDVAERYEGKPPPFPIILDSVTGMAAANTTTDRMRDIVRKAQRDFQFATIFEQRKTNQLLVAGFTNLAQALDGMGRRIESSIMDLEDQISQMSSTLDGSLQNLGSSIGENLTALNESSMESSQALIGGVDGLRTIIQGDTKVRAERHKQTLKMLNDIQQERKPLV